MIEATRSNGVMEYWSSEDRLEPRRGGLFIAPAASVPSPNPVGVACESRSVDCRLRNGNGADTSENPKSENRNLKFSGHPYGVNKNVIVWAGGAINRPPLRGLKSRSSLHHSTAPSLHHSITPSLHYSTSAHV